MDIGDNKMEKIDLEGVKKIANGICQKYFFNRENCEEKVESAILDITNMEDYTEEQLFTLFTIAPIILFKKQDNIITTYSYIANALQQSIDIVKDIAKVKYISSVPPHIEYMCQNYTRDKEECIDDVDRMLFMHMMNMYALSYIRKKTPLDDEFVYLLSHLLENITLQHTVSGNPEQGEKLIETAKEYLDMLLKEIKKRKTKGKK